MPQRGIDAVPRSFRGNPQDLGKLQKIRWEYGVTEFIVGHYGGFDRIAARAVIDAKAQHPEITLSILIPYHPAKQPVELPSGFDNTFYPPGMEKVPRRLAIVRANHYMVDHVDYLIAYAWHPGSNARDLKEYALQKQIPATNIAFTDFFDG